MSTKCPHGCQNVHFRPNVRKMSAKCPEKMSTCPEPRNPKHYPDQCLRGFCSNIRTNVQMSTQCPNVHISRQKCRKNVHTNVQQTIRLLICAQPLGLSDGPAISPMKSGCTCRDVHSSHRVTMYCLSIVSIGVAQAHPRRFVGGLARRFNVQT